MPEELDACVPEQERAGQRHSGSVDKAIAMTMFDEVDVFALVAHSATSGDQDGCPSQDERGKSRVGLDCESVGDVVTDVAPVGAEQEPRQEEVPRLIEP